MSNAKACEKERSQNVFWATSHITVYNGQQEHEKQKWKSFHHGKSREKGIPFLQDDHPAHSAQMIPILFEYSHQCY
jgi:hypothetical protein